MQVPDFELNRVGGGAFRLVDLKGKYILLEIGATWCPTCRSQDEEIRAGRDFLSRNDIAVVRVFVNESSSSIQGYLSKGEGDSFGILLLADHSFAKNFGLYLIPRVILIDQNFRVQFDGNFLSAKDFEREFKRLQSARIADRFVVNFLTGDNT